MSRCTDCAQFPCECGNQMTTDHELLARIKEKGSADFATLKYNPEGQKDIQDVFEALCAVVELKDCTLHHSNINQDDKHFRHGYNQCLADVKQAIEKELG